MNAVIAPARRLLVAFAVLLGLLAPMLVSVSSAEAATPHRTCSYGRAHAWYRNAHPYWWNHHCPKMAAALRGKAVDATYIVSTAAGLRGTNAEKNIAVVVLNLINRQRAANHLRPLTSDPALITSSWKHNLLMAKYNTMSHQLPGEAGLGDRIDAAGYHWMWAGENVAWNSSMTQAGVVDLQYMMYHEVAPNDGHRLNILSTHFTNVGVNVYTDRTNGKVWLTTDFGSR